LDQPKVYEFAKEIGIETLTLMDKIRKWDLPIKSHMAELSPEVIDQIRTKLDEESGSSKKKAKKKTATKKKATKKAATKKTATKKAATKKKATKKATSKKTTKKKAATTVIRRKKASEVAEEALKVASAEASEVTAPVEAPAPATPQESIPTPPMAAAPAAEAVLTDDKAAAPSTARKREVKMTEGGPVSGVKSERPRRNIVGKMDLSKVENKSQGGNRPQKTSTRNIRPGFVAANQPMEPSIVDDSDRFGGRKDKDKRKRMVAVPGPSKKDQEQAPPSFVSSDFKKREVVFQPKKKKIATNLAEMKQTLITTPAAHKRVVRVHGTMKVSDLANEMGIKAPQLVKALIKNGVMGNMNTELDFDTISLIVSEFNYEAENILKSDDELIEAAAFGDLDAEKVQRSPIVTVMGHVDHGKTTLLDTIRNARVVEGEAGGITQHVGAYRVKTKIGECTFIDTPGHEAFTAMRARGASSTDIVILVVSADDGVMPQTIEAISHSKAAGVPIIVAMNKMDKAGANPDKIKQQLAEHELVPEDWGGDTMCVPVSALKGDGIDELLEQVSLLAEVLELKGNPKRSATGIVVESRVEVGKGNVATLLVQDGTLKKGQDVVVGAIPYRVRQLFDEAGNRIEEAGPSHPVEVIGLPDSPLAGDPFDACKDEKTAERIANQRAEERKAEKMAAQAAPTNLEDLFSKVKAGDLKELPVVLKTDVAGTGEAIRGMFDKISTDEVKIKVIHHGVGGISASDVLLASTAGGLIIGFNTRPDNAARAASKERGVEIKTHSIVYKLMDEMKLAMAGLLDPDLVEKAMGRAEVRDTFSVPKIGTIAGSFVVDGKITRNSLLRLVRDGTVIYTGKISSLKRFKDDAKEVAQGYECGIGIENFNDIKVGDEIEAYIEEEVAREL
jgi:translation initiation factor IF-2